MPLSSLFKSINGFLHSIPSYIENLSDSKHEKSTGDSTTEAVDVENSNRTAISAIPENEPQPEEHVHPADEGIHHNDEPENPANNPELNSDNKQKSPPASQGVEACDKQNTTIDTTAEAISDKPVETTPDVYLDVPSLKVQELKLNVEDLDAKVALNAELAGLIKINVGVNVGIKKLDLDIKGVDVKAVLKVRLKQVYNIFDRALNTVDNNPEILNGQTFSPSESAMELQSKSAQSSIKSNNQLSNETTDTIGNADDSIQAHHSIKKGEERYRFREDTKKGDS